METVTPTAPTPEPRQETPEATAWSVACRIADTLQRPRPVSLAGELPYDVKLINDALSTLTAQNEALTKQIAELERGVPSISKTGDGSILALFMKCDAACVDQYPDGSIVVIVRVGDTDNIYSNEEEITALTKRLEEAERSAAAHRRGVRMGMDRRRPSIVVCGPLEARH